MCQTLGEKTARRNLVVVRSGDNSRHPEWIGVERSWDLALSYFGTKDRSAFPEADYFHSYKGGKWDGLFSFFKENSILIEKYDYIWLPDDDISTNCSAIDRLFSFVSECGAELGQPSLSRDSYLSHVITLTNPIFEFRYVNFVEIMVPVLSRELLKKVLPMFECTRSGYGLDLIWHRFTRDPYRSVVIIDGIQVTHTRPGGAALQRVITEQRAASTEEEMNLLLEPYGEFMKTHTVFAGRLRGGIWVKGRVLSSAIAAFGWACSPIGLRFGRQTVRTLTFLKVLLRDFIAIILSPAEIGRTEPVAPKALRPTLNASGKAG